MAIGREAAHVGADLGHDGTGAEITDTRDRGQQPDRDAKRLDVGVHLRIDFGDGGVEGINLLKMQA